MSGSKPRAKPRRRSSRLILLAAVVVVALAGGLAVLYSGVLRGGPDFGHARLVWTLPGTRDDGLVNAVAFSPDGKTLATVGTSYTDYTSDTMGRLKIPNVVDLWDVTTRQRVSSLTCDSAPLDLEPGIQSIAFSPDGRTLAVTGSCAGNENGEWGVQLWDVASHRLITTLPNPTGDPESSFRAYLNLSFSPDGRMLAAGGQGPDRGTIDLWDTTNRRLVAELTSGTVGTQVESVAFSRDGRTLASATYGNDPHNNPAQLWDVGSRRLVATLPNRESRAVAFSPDGSTLAVAGADDSVQLWDAGTHRLTTTLVTYRPEKIMPLTDVEFSPDGSILAATDFAGTVTLWDPASHEVITTLSCGCPPRSLGFLTLAFGPDGDLLAAGGVDAIVDVWRGR